MKRKPIKIDWEELESAFQSKREDLVYYLDLVTGHVVLEGEGEATQDDDLDEGMEDPGQRRNETTRLYIDPPDLGDEVDWMEEFAENSKGADAEVVRALGQALDEADPVEAFREVLRGHAEERDRWFLFRSERIHQRIDEWLDEHSIRTVDPAPWNS